MDGSLLFFILILLLIFPPYSRATSLPVCVKLLGKAIQPLKMPQDCSGEADTTSLIASSKPPGGGKRARRWLCRGIHLLESLNHECLGKPARSTVCREGASLLKAKFKQSRSHKAIGPAKGMTRGRARGDRASGSQRQSGGVSLYWRGSHRNARLPAGPIFPTPDHPP
jgi:hypothetical protein